MADTKMQAQPLRDMLDEDIPVVDLSGKKILVRGSAFVDPASAEAPAGKPSSAPAKAAVPVTAAIPVGPQAATPKPLEAQPANARGDFGLDAAKDDADLKKIQAVMAAKTGGPVAATTAEATLLDATLERALVETAKGIADEDMRRRYRMLVSLYFRDLRDMLETKSKFTMPVTSGGMGMADVDADRTMETLRAMSAAYRDALVGKAADDKGKYVAARTETVLGAQDKKDQADHEKREQAYSGLVQRAGMGEASSNAALPPVSPAKEPKVVPVVGLDAKGKPLPVAVAVPKPPQPAPAPSVTSDPLVSGTTVSGTTVSGTTVSGTGVASPAPAMADARFAAKLTGPVEELRSLGLKDFRRLSREPREATLKIKDKIDLLEEQSFEVKTQGIAAWQASEVNKVYLDILRQSLEGKPITDVIAAREAKGEPVLTKPEFDAVMDLNRTLRFG